MKTSLYPDTLLLIDNAWSQASDGRWQDVVNPATGNKIGRVAHASLDDLDRALAAAKRGFEIWKATSAHERAALMRRAASLLRERIDDIAPLITLEQGKPLQEARAELEAAAPIIEWFADEGLRVYGRIVPSRSPNVQQLVLKEPVGPVAAFTPWNFPVNQIVRKLSAALTTGCSFLVKAPEETPASPAALLQAFVDAGLPPGVLGLVYGDPQQISSHLIAHPIIRKVTFTGSTPVGKQLASLAGAHMKRVTMELGGHAPVIVAEDADLDLAVSTAGLSAFRNAGQVCISPTRFLVHNSRKDEFNKALVRHAESLRIGDGLDTNVTLGPLANPRRLSAMITCVEDALEKGAVLLTGGKRLGECGNFFAPTILDDVPVNASIFNEEPFGPIAGIRGYDDLGEPAEFGKNRTLRFSGQP
ncbi:NAD-dependent succinate-semialdehyde dehydrogenase [Pseudomonas chlororaphis]|uniref:NAD-dependent succinate-semialdehyde dehydrogenase n=1 Tax=Pseudomonas chlororaphis TaxID=587753 RepID=UPI00240879DC|nr:NAD-dependent succinate-semialdehyde dehydrogenase [Pseudomonas chlororaphis]